MIDLRYLKKLIEMVDESSVDSIEISSEKGVKIRIAKSPVQRGVSVATPMPMPAVMSAPMLESRVTPNARLRGAKPYVAVGDRVLKGQTLCIIEAMKIMNEIESEFAGVVREILAQDAQPVEYGQVLFRIDPNG